MNTALSVMFALFVGFACLLFFMSSDLMDMSRKWNVPDLSPDQIEYAFTRVRRYSIVMSIVSFTALMLSFVFIFLGNEYCS